MPRETPNRRKREASPFRQGSLASRRSLHLDAELNLYADL